MTMEPEEIKRRFRAHGLDMIQQKDCDVLRQQYEYVAQQILARTPQSREQSLALTQLEQSAFWAVAAIARH